MRKSFVFLVFLLITKATLAQVSVPLHISQQLKGNYKFNDYARLMSRYLDSLRVAAKDSATIKSVIRKQKKLARQLYYLESHQDENGNITQVNEKTLKAVERFEQSEISQQSMHLGNWTTYGPLHMLTGYGNSGIGRVDRIVFHPTDPNIVYAGTPSGGLWKSTTSGTVWNSITGYIPSMGVSGIVVSHANPSTLYVLTGDGDSNLGDGGFVEAFDYIRPSVGVLKSTDEGVTWRKTGLNIPGFYVGYKLVQSPTDANVLIAATSKGLYRTDNGGTDWELVSSDSSRYYDIEWKPGAAAAVYACTANRLFISATAGISFADITSRIPESISSTQRLALAVTPNNANIIYVLSAQEWGINTILKVYRSTNSGGVFFLRKEGQWEGGTPGYMTNIAADPNNYNNVAVGNLRTLFSEDGAANYARISNNDNDTYANYIHSDIHELSYNPHTGVLFIGSDGGVFTTDDNGQDINQKLLGMANTQFYHFNMGDDESLLVGGAQDNGLMFRSGSTNFYKNYLRGDGFDVAMPHAQGTFILSTLNTGVRMYQTDFPNTYFYLNGPDDAWFKSTATSWFDSTKFVGGNKIYKITNFSSSSIPYSSYDAKGNWALTTSPSNGNRLYAAGGPGYNDGGEQSEKTMSRSDDKGVTWTALHNNPGFPTVFGKITSIAVDPTNSGRVYVTFGGYQAAVKVFFSANAGANWTNISGGLPDVPVNAVTVNDNGDVYIGTDIGVFYRVDGGTAWVPFFNGLPKVPVTDLEIRNSYIFASTFGRGIWGSSTRGNCPPTETVTGEKYGRIFYEARIINASAQLTRGAGTEIYLKAENEVNLTPGFVANGNTGVEFRAWIAPCGSGATLFNFATLENKNTAALSLDTASINFNLSFPSLVTVYVTDTVGNVVGTVSKPIRLNEGLQKIPLHDKIVNGKLVLVADGSVMGILDLPKMAINDDRKKVESKPKNVD